MHYGLRVWGVQGMDHKKKKKKMFLVVRMLARSLRLIVDQPWPCFYPKNASIQEVLIYRIMLLSIAKLLSVR